jgi:hypothetical protein
MACISKRRGRWDLDFYDQHGKRQRLALPEGTNKGQAKEELRAIEEMVAKGIFLPRVYAHLMKPTNQEAVCRLENTVFGATGHRIG